MLAILKEKLQKSRGFGAQST